MHALHIAPHVQIIVDSNVALAPPNALQVAVLNVILHVQHTVNIHAQHHA